MKIIAVVPAYNESQIIAEVVQSLKNEVNKVVVVDDGSIDNTSELAKREGAVVLQHFLNRGQGAALQTGINYALNAGADIIVTFDADGQHDASDVKKIVEPLLLGGVDVVLGSRFLKSPKSPFSPLRRIRRVGAVQSSKSGMPFLKLLILKMALWFDKIRTGLKITDTHNGFRAMSSGAAAKIKITQDGMAHASEILEQIKRLGLRYKEVPVNIKYTDYSKKKGQRLGGSAKILWDLLWGRIGK